MAASRMDLPEYTKYMYTDHAHHHHPHGPIKTTKRKKLVQWNVRASTFAKNTNNPIRNIVDGLKLTPNPEKKMIALSIGDPTVFGNLPPSQEVEQSLVNVIKEEKHNGYAPSVGFVTARAAVAEYYTSPEAPLTEEDVVLASGCSGALDLCITVLANPGQNILCPKPGFSLYKTLAHSFGIEVKYYNLDPDKGWMVDLDHLDAQFDDQTAAVITNNPSNPCGSVFPRDHIKDILKIAGRHRVPVIADEVYAEQVFEGHTYHSFASQTSDVPVLSCGGLTKRWLVPGYRMGWILIHDRNDVFDKEVREGLVALSTRLLGPNTVVQGALPHILKKTPKEYFDHNIKYIESNAKLSFERISAIPGLKPVMPSGAMYMMVGIDLTKFPKFKCDLEFVENLVTEQSVFCLPAKCFEYPNYFRIVLTVPTESLEEACRRITEFAAKHYASANGVEAGR